MPGVAINVGNLIRRELRRRVGGVAKAESQVRRYTGKGLNNVKLPKNAKLPAGFKAPKSVVFQDLPKTSTGKIQKFELRLIARAG